MYNITRVCIKKIPTCIIIFLLNTHIWTGLIILFWKTKITNNLNFLYKCDTNYNIVHTSKEVIIQYQI